MPLQVVFNTLMDIGSPIQAARAGQVASIEARFFDGNNEERGFNYVAIAHENGTFAFYMHITQGGAAVELREYVKQGGVIGNCATFPIPGKNAKPNNKIMIQGMDYTAL